MRRLSPDSLEVQFFVTLGLAAVIVLAMLASIILNAVACPTATPTPTPTEWTSQL